jgi:hypothetical protein
MGDVTVADGGAGADCDDLFLADSTKRSLLRRWLDQRLVHQMAPQARAVAEGLREVRQRRT